MRVSDGASLLAEGPVDVGDSYTGTLYIERGGSVTSTGGHLGWGGDGIAIVSGANSVWTINSWLGQPFTVGLAHTYNANDRVQGNGSLLIADGGSLHNFSGSYIGDGLTSPAGTTGQVTVVGSGSTWTSGFVTVGHGSGVGTLGILGGASVSAAGMAIGPQSVLTIDVQNGSLLSIGDGTSSVTNDGTVRIVAGANAAVLDLTPTCADPNPIVAGSYSGSGIVQTIGGSGGWNCFYLSPVAVGTPGAAVGIDLQTTQRIRIDDDSTGWSLGASFLSAATSTPLTFQATAIGGDVLTSLQDLLTPDETVLGGWEMSATGGYSPGDPAYLSIKIGDDHARADLQVWHYDGTTWSRFEAPDLNCTGEFANFMVYGFSGYAVTTVAEPTSLGLLTIGLLAMLVFWARTTRARAKLQDL